jgi:hypothetical protein
MLVIISDLHLTDGTSGSTISPGAFQLLGERIADLTMGASQRRDGSYPARSIASTCYCWATSST